MQKGAAISFQRWSAWLAVASVTVASLTPTPHLPAGIFNFWDKAQHVLAFFVLGGLGVLAYPKSVIRVLAGLFIYGGLIELAQALGGWRQGDWQDWLADGLGLALAFWVWYVLSRWRLRPWRWLKATVGAGE